MKLIIMLSMLSTFIFADDIAKYKNTVITSEEVERTANLLTKGKYASLEGDVKKQIDNRVFNQVIRSTILVDIAKKSNIEKDKAYKEAYAERVKLLKNELILSTYFEKEFKNFKVSKSDVAKFYKENKEQFTQPNMVDVSHILVKDKDEAEDIIDDLEDSNNVAKEFAKLAKKHSIDTSNKDRGGNVGKITKDSKVAPEFKELAFELKKGKFNKKPLKTQFGYHVLYIVDILPSKVISLKEAESQGLSEKVKQIKFAQKLQEQLKNPLSKVKVIDKNYSILEEDKLMK